MGKPSLSGSGDACNSLQIICNFRVRPVEKQVANGFGNFIGGSVNTVGSVEAGSGPSFFGLGGDASQALGSVTAAVANGAHNIVLGDVNTTGSVDAGHQEIPHFLI